MELDLAKVVLEGASLLFSLVAVVIATVSSKFKASKDAITRVENTARERLDRHESRIQSLEERADAAPSSAEFSDLRQALTKMDGDVRVLSQSLKGHADILTRIERPLGLLMEHHLKEGASR